MKKIKDKRKEVKDYQLSKLILCVDCDMPI